MVLRLSGKVAVIPTPVYSDGHVYISSGYGIGCKLVKLTATGAKDVYDNKIMKNHHGVIKFGDHLYGYSMGTVGFVRISSRAS